MSNMLFRGDGKSNIFNYDFFSEEFDESFKNAIENREITRPTIGFINPPYSGSFTNPKDLLAFKTESSKESKSKSKKPWIKEISFLQKMCSICTRYVIMIAPPQTFMSENDLRDKILEANTLKCIINMPSDLFQPNASTGSTIIVMETNRPHDYSKDVAFYNLKKDGFELAKKKGRRDIYGKWSFFKGQLLESIDAPYYRQFKNVDEVNFCVEKIKSGDEWLIQNFSKVDFSSLSNTDFENTIKEFLIFNTKKELGVLEEEINELDLLEILQRNNVNAKSFSGEENE